MQPEGPEYLAYNAKSYHRMNNEKTMTCSTRPSARTCK